MKLIKKGNTYAPPRHDHPIPVVGRTLTCSRCDAKYEVEPEDVRGRVWRNVWARKHWHSVRLEYCTRVSWDCLECGRANHTYILNEDV